MELVLEFWIFHKKGYVNKNNQINFFNYKITFQRFGKKYREHSVKKCIFDVLNRVLALQMKVCHF